MLPSSASDITKNVAWILPDMKDTETDTLIKCVKYWMQDLSELFCLLAVFCMCIIEFVIMWQIVYVCDDLCEHHETNRLKKWRILMTLANRLFLTFNVAPTFCGLWFVMRIAGYGIKMNWTELNWTELNWSYFVVGLTCYSFAVADFFCFPWTKNVFCIFRQNIAHVVCLGNRRGWHGRQGDEEEEEE